MRKNLPKNIYKVGSLRVWNMIQLPNEPIYYPVKSPKHGKTLINALADSQLLDTNITDNAFGMEILEKDGEWCDWEDNDGNNITDDECSVE